MYKEFRILAVALVGLVGVASMIASGAGKMPRLDAPMCKAAGKVTECLDVDYGRHPPRPILH